MQNYEVLIQGLSHDGRGIARLNGKAIFVSGALPGETVSINVIRQHKHHDEAVVKTVLVSSPQRVSPVCDYHAQCGGCVLQHLESAEQLSYKEQAFWETLSRIGGVEPKEKLPAIAGPSLGYRHRARLHVQVKNKTVSVGYKSKFQPDAVTKVEHCAILAPELSEVLPELNELLSSFKRPDLVESILLSQAKEGMSIELRTRAKLHSEDQHIWEAFAEKQKYLKNIDELTYPFSESFPHLHFTPTDFTQVNVQVNEAMLKAALEMMRLDKTDKLADLYSGLGNFALFLAPYVSQIYGAEYDSNMVKRAKANAAYNEFTHLQFETLDLDHPRAVADFFQRHDMNKLILDPSRSGAKVVVETMPRKKIQGILYVSCHPGTLARDAKILVYEKKYTLKTARVVDMFPHTGHLEAMAWFER